jgi:hypothetical protein
MLDTFVYECNHNFASGYGGIEADGSSIGMLALVRPEEARRARERSLEARGGCPDEPRFGRFWRMSGSYASRPRAGLRQRIYLLSA